MISDGKEIDMDQLMEMIEEMPEEEVIQAFAAEEPEQAEQEEREEPQKESKDAKLAFETMNTNLRLQQENDKLRAEKSEVERLAMQGVIQNFETQINMANSDIGKLNQDLVRARDEGDTSASVEIESRLRESYDRVRDLKGKVEQYVPYLNQAQAQPKTEAQPGNQMAFEWLKENENWLQDDKFRDKREYADNLFKEMSTSGQNMNNVNFWTKFEKKLTEYDFKKSPEKSQSRMPKNMVTYNSNSSSSNNPKKQSYKDNPEFLQKVAFLAKNVIRNEDILKDKNLLNSTLKHYHKVWKSGGFKYLPLNVQG